MGKLKEINWKELSKDFELSIYLSNRPTNGTAFLYLELYHSYLSNVNQTNSKLNLKMKYYSGLYIPMKQEWSLFYLKRKHLKSHILKMLLQIQISNRKWT